MAPRNYGRELLKLAYGRDPLETRGRKQKIELPASFRHDVALINKKNPKLMSRRETAKRLLDQPKYHGINKRKIERGVDGVVAGYARAYIDVLKDHAPDHLHRLAKTPKRKLLRELREKAFEVMRKQFGPKFILDH